MNSKIQLFFMAFLFAIIAYAGDGVVRIPLKTFTKPPSNLQSGTGKVLSFAELAAMYKQNQDLSKLQPTEDKYWQNKKYSAFEENINKEMPDAEVGVSIDSYMGANRELGFYSVIVKPSSGKSERYGLTLGLKIHSSLLKSALLRKIGYYQESPKHYSKIKLNFETVEEKNFYIKTAFCDVGPNEEAIDCLSLEAFQSGTNKREFLSNAGEKSLYVHGAYLEKMNSEVPGLFDGLTPATGSLIPYFSQARQFRALAIPFVLGDSQESLNRFSTQAAFVRDGWVNLSYPFNDYFSETSSDDARWILRRIAALTDADWNEIIVASKYPVATHQLLKAKLLYRTKNLIQSFFDRSEANALFKLNIPSLKYNSPDGYVADGRVTTEYIPGYPQRFSHGERQSPFESGDLVRYMTIKSQSSVLGAAIAKLNKDLGERSGINKSKVTSTKTTGFRMTDKGYVPVGSATGQSYGLNFGASRIVTTGTYYGSQAAVQLVDNVSWNVGIGVFKVIDDFNGVRNNMGANVGYSRDFTHVRPLNSMKETKEIAWKDVYVPSKLAQLGSPLNEGKIAEFSAALSIGEVFTITESVGVSGRFGYEMGLDSLIGFSGTTVPMLGLTAGANRVILRQTQIMKTSEGFQVFIRNQNTKAFNVTFDADYFINLLRIKHETTATDLHTDAFVLNYSNDFISQIEKAVETVKETAKTAEKDPEQAVKDYFTENPDIKTKYDSQNFFSHKLANAMRGLILQSSADQLYRNFKKQEFSIDHGINTKEIKLKLLWYRASFLEEEHKLKIFKPVLTAVESGSVENKPIEVVTYRKGELTGRDSLGFSLGILDWGLQKKFKDNAPVFSQESQNPSQMPFGRAQWHIIRADTELTQDRVGALPSVAIIQNVWGGWSLKKKDLDDILEKIKKRFAGTKFETQEIIPAEAFSQVKKIDFFRITENLSLLPTALDKLKELMIYPDATGIAVDRARFLARLFQKLSELGKNNKARAEDKVIFKNVMTMIGDGDEKKGQELYMDQCKANAVNPNDDSQIVNTVTWSKGTKFECLEPWISKLISISHKFINADLRTQNKLMAEMIYNLEKNIPLPVLLNAIGEENYLYFVEITGFRSGDEDADQGFYVSNSIGLPAEKHPYSNGLISVFAEKSKIIPIELDRSQGSFQ